MTRDPEFTATQSLDWAEIHRVGRDLARLLAPHGPFKGIVAVTRGGLVPAAILARELDIRLVETVCVSSYGDGTRHRLSVLKDIAAGDFADGAGWLVVDDLADTGATAQIIRRRLPKAHFATLYAKPVGRPHIDTFVKDVDQEIWLVFPWDEPESI